METFRIIDLTKNPNTVVPGKDSITFEEAAEWIEENGGDCPLCDYTIIKNEQE